MFKNSDTKVMNQNEDHEESYGEEDLRKTFGKVETIMEAEEMEEETPVDRINVFRNQLRR